MSRYTHLSRFGVLAGRESAGVVVGALRGVPAEMGDGRRRYLAGWSREEASSLNPFASWVSLRFRVSGFLIVITVIGQT
jgi:hypothetical protein